MECGSVLVVEDDASLVRAIVRNLVARGFPARSATTVHDAVQSLEIDPPAILVLDIDLPDGSGWEVLRALRAKGGDVTVIIMSALKPNPRLAAELCADHVIEKPFPIDSLLRLCSQAAGVPSDTIPFAAGAEG
ncbi:MAG: response regulator [Chloroflexota bacterium]|nr:response regulator [Chloroflexota bacterium]